ncbi:hypothetical protein F67_I3_11_042 [Rhizobium phage RHph_I3_11]|nr:hypothetical protein F67_I3_11_042 [Rhizobium phage RHph_I3_11]
MFKVGDRVKLKNNQDDHGKGLCGILRDDESEGLYIQFDEFQEFAHTCDENTLHGFGWWVDEENLEPEFSVKEFISDQTGDTEEDI